MKKATASFLRFSRTERAGILCFLVVLSLLFLFRYALRRSPPSLPAAVAGRLQAQWEACRKAEETLPSGPHQLHPFRFDPNTIDSAGILALGLAPRVAKGWLNWRRHGKVFYSPEDLKPLYHLADSDYQRLAPYIVVAAVRPGGRDGFVPYHREPLPATISLNTADSALLVRLNGIGPVLAHKIVTMRARLGGFVRHEQLLEIYRFPDTIFRTLREKLLIDPSSVRKMGLNTAGLDEMKQHPYIGEKMARNILLYREGLKRFENIEQLRQVPLMNEENYRRIAPYFVTD